MSAAGIIFSNLNNTTNTLLTTDRTIAAVPFACRYRLVDFALANFVNAGITNIDVIVNYNYRSLAEHIGSGKDWDLARRGGGISLISPYQLSSRSGSKLYATHLEALIDIAAVINDIHEEQIVLCDSDIVCNFDLSAALAYHNEKDADITMVTVPNKPRWTSRYSCLNLVANEDGRVQDIVLNTEYDAAHPELCLNIFIMNTNRLRSILADAAAHNYTSLSRDILMKDTKELRFFRYQHNGYYAFMADAHDYYVHSMELLSDADAREDLLAVKERPVYTNVHNSASVRYGEEACVTGSMIADGCVIEGTVENCIIFRGVHIGKGSVVRNSIIFGKTYIGRNVTLDAVVCDKEVLISDGKHLAGCAELPYFIPKKKHI